MRILHVHELIRCGKYKRLCALSANFYTNSDVSVYDLAGRFGYFYYAFFVIFENNII